MQTGTLASPFTAENAREMNARGWQKRRAEMKRLYDLEKAHEKLLAKLAEMPAPNDRAKRMEKQLDLLEKLMHKSQDAKELANLSAAHARLFSAWCILTGTQLPSKAKVGRRTQAAPIAPLPDSPAPIAPASPASDPAAPRSEDCTG